ncbi:Dihydroorotate dehydrogenase B (NAD(+)), electron transfer subunit [Aquicella siphonis]|uniref:Dihydroorotate dehydrogenase B (NAD(+)), electron transfer subunit n=1 Tax=Aquicella siphonis TaxID=254247 RepID=A0A5E4PGP4_9COXI|nr:FAD-dependent oxidoreductase [Aquicella siphonis]VVC76210.1 Dihydroorotate dehydrogenase B (NAD(+)), electron transfer subunit [Aquicella siphonis]
MTSHPELRLKGFTFSELLRSEGLNRLDDEFLSFLGTRNPALQEQMLAYRRGTGTFTTLEISELLIHCARILEDFLADLFQIQEAAAISRVRTTSFNPVSTFKKYFVLRRAKKDAGKADSFPSFSELQAWLTAQLKTAPLQTDDREMAVSLLGTQYLNAPDTHAEDIEKLVQWCVRALTTPEGQTETAGWPSFNIPERIDFMNLVHTRPAAQDKWGRVAAPDSELRLRDGFKLTDQRMSAREVQDEVNYCIYCHDHDGDFCSKGFPVKKGDPAQGFKKNALNVTLTGCPLEEKISEMHFLKKEGYTLAALAMVMVDNPMCPATGHRICNECMKACIYQKQDPVNIPQIETRVLTDVLDLPWGVEIYDLLTRWNPLRQHQWVMKPYNGLKIMIAGMGPAGFTLAHHLLLEGFAVVGFDGLKIEPLPERLIHHPVYRFADLMESLDQRLMAGFGGVAEYGITVRWDKNFLKLIYLSLMRRPHFQVFGGVRFGGTLTIEDAWDLGFDHFVVAVGAGLPKALPIPGSLAPGMRQANDFLMALQLGNAAKSSSLTSLQIRLPAVVIGGGLTGVDTATELQAYYISQVEKIQMRYEILAAEYGEEFIHQQMDAASREILAEYIRHGEAVRKERERARTRGEQPDFIKLAREWGGVTIAYRRSMQESPAYINNHEELQKALEEGIYYLEGMEPAAVDLNEYGHAETLICHKRIRNQNHEWVTTTEEIRLPARSILVATGTQPNTAYEFEHRGTFNRLNLQYQHYEDIDDELNVAHGVEHCKDAQFGPFTSYHKHDRRVSLIGDTHPVFHGSVVKAIASGLRTYPKIVASLQHKLLHPGSEEEYQEFAARMNYLFSAHVKNIVRKTRHHIELTVQAPLAAKHFKPGQFYRLQNLETLAPRIDHTLLQMEPLALVAAECSRSDGCLTFIVAETSATAKLCAALKPGEPVSLMGPTGVRTKIPSEHETVLIIGNASSYAFVRSYGAEMRAAGNHVIYVSLFNHPDEVFCQPELENAADRILWLSTNSHALPAPRPSDLCMINSPLIPALKEQAHTLLLGDVDRIFLIGNTDLLRTFQAARKPELKSYLHKDPKVFASVYGNMQCMLKGVCAQCLQWQIDPETGQRTKAVFACSWQDQPLEIIDIDHIDARSLQNRLLDQLSNLWVEHIFKKYDIARI